MPQTFLVDEHRILQYTSKDNDGRIIKVERSSVSSATVLPLLLWWLPSSMENSITIFLWKGIPAATKTAL